MNEELEIETIAPEVLLARTGEFRGQDYRLVQISATRLSEGVELTYSFDRRNQLKHLRIQLPSAKPTVPSITSVYWAAFLYENELHDLFHVHVEGIAVDFQGTLYKTAIKFPFGSTKVPQAKPASGANPQPAAPVAPQATARADTANLPTNSRN